MNINEEKAKKFFNNNNQSLTLLPLKFILILTFFFLLSVPLTSAVETTVGSDFAQGETLLARFSGNFVDQITANNIKFYRDHNPTAVDYGVVRIENDFYVYAILTGKNQGNYSIRIEGVRYYQATQIVDDDIVSNFTISGETARFSVNPGVVKTQADFSVELQNLEDNAITVGISNPESITSASSINLNTGEKKTVIFSLDAQVVKGLSTIEFSSGNTSYIIPVYLDTNITEPGEQTNNFDMEFQPRTVSVSLATDSDSKRILYLKNTGEETLEDISFTVSSVLEPYVVVSPNKINSLSPGETEQVEINIVSDLEEATIEGRITARAENVSAYFTLILDFVKDFIPTETPGEDPTIVPTCSDLDGTVCADNFECTGETKRARDGICCPQPATCEEPKKSSSRKIIGWGLLLIVLVMIFWFFRRRYRRVMPRRPF